MNFCNVIEMQNKTSTSKLLLLLHISSYTNPKCSDYHHLRIVGLRLEANILKYHNLRIGRLKRTNLEQGKSRALTRILAREYKQMQENILPTPVMTKQIIMQTIKKTKEHI